MNIYILTGYYYVIGTMYNSLQKFYHNENLKQLLPVSYYEHLKKSQHIAYYTLTVSRVIF